MRQVIAQLGLGIHVDGDSDFVSTWGKDEQVAYIERVEAQLLGHAAKPTLQQLSHCASVLVTLDDNGRVLQSDTRDAVNTALDHGNELEGIGYEFRVVDSESARPSGVTYIWVGPVRLCIYSFTLEYREKESGHYGPWTVPFDLGDRGDENCQIQAQLSWRSDVS